MARVVVYTKNYCSFCHAAKSLLKSKGVEFEEIDMTEDAVLQDRIRRLSGQRTVPQIFIDGQPVGGFEDLRRLDRSGELDRLLGAATS
jgi:glutaredoxin 3